MKIYVVECEYKEVVLQCGFSLNKKTAENEAKKCIENFTKYTGKHTEYWIKEYEVKNEKDYCTFDD